MKTISVNKKSRKVSKLIYSNGIITITANILGILVTSRLITHFCCEHNVRRFARGDCKYHVF